MRSFISAALAMTVATAYEAVDHQKFLNFIAKYNKVYKNVHEFEARLSNFVQTLKEIEAENSTNENFKLGINKFADLTSYEMRQFLGRNPGSNKEHYKTFSADESALTATKDELNWCNEGACTPVKDQGQCGSCWTFSAVETIESAYQIQRGTLYNLSE